MVPAGLEPIDEALAETDDIGGEFAADSTCLQAYVLTCCVPRTPLQTRTILCQAKHLEKRSVLIPGLGIRMT